MLQAPFPWFGAKSRAAPLIWERLGDVKSYVEPFAGSLAVLLGRPAWHLRAADLRYETVNDLDGFLVNFWRAITNDPDEVARWADWPVTEIDLTARHVWLVKRREELSARLMGDPDYYDAKVAGWWVWGLSAWIGSGWCSGEGPWQSIDGKLVRRGDDNGKGVSRKRPHLTNNRGVETTDSYEGLRAWFEVLSQRLRRVRIVCGDWSRVLTPVVIGSNPPTGIVLDPPYSHAERDTGMYAHDEDGIAADVRQWAIDHGDDLNLRIVLCGYDGEHDMPIGWELVEWTAHGGYAHLGDGRGKVNRFRERLWFSPGCLGPAQPRLL